MAAPGGPGLWLFAAIITKNPCRAHGNGRAAQGFGSFCAAAGSMRTCEYADVSRIHRPDRAILGGNPHPDVTLFKI
jgi:hypothetical protein